MLNEQQISRKRNPTRVDLAYKPLKGTEMVRIPFRAGVMGNFTGHRKDLPDLEAREFTKIDKFNFDSVMSNLRPTLEILVDDTINPESDQPRSIKLVFKKWSDFHPDELIKQIPVLKQLHEIRERLMAAKTTAETHGSVARLLNDIQSEISELKKQAES